MKDLTPMILLAALGALAGATGTVSAQSRNPDAWSSTLHSSVEPIRSADRKFLENAARGSAVEIALGRMTLEKSGNTDVRKFSRMVLDDHTRANDALSVVAGRRSVELPSQLSREQLKQRNDLYRLWGADFDRAYLNVAVRNHKRTVEMFEHEANSGSDLEVMNFAARTLPTLRAHLAQAQELAARKHKAASKK